MFDEFIKNILENYGRMKRKYVDFIITKEALQYYAIAFTHNSVNGEENYEFNEFIGDSTLNKIITWYLIKRFPFLKRPKFVQILARLKINLISKKSLYKIAENLGFWEHIKCSAEIAAVKKKSLLEDVLEAFIGVTESLIDEKTKFGVGYVICYNIISCAFDKIDISLEYEDLYDAKTRLKEIFDKNVGLGKLKFQTIDTGNKNYHRVIIMSGENQLAAAASHTLLIDAQQSAAELAIKILKQRGVVKSAPEIYDEIRTKLNLMSRGNK